MILNETQTAIRDAVRVYAQEQLRPRSAAFEAAGGYPDGLFEELAGLGLMGLTAPAAFGGAEADYVSYALSLIEIAAADGALSTIISVQNSRYSSGVRCTSAPLTKTTRFERSMRSSPTEMTESTAF